MIYSVKGYYDYSIKPPPEEQEQQEQKQGRRVDTGKHQASGSSRASDDGQPETGQTKTDRPEESKQDSAKPTQQRPLASPPDITFTEDQKKQILQRALSQARGVRAFAKNYERRLKNMDHDANNYEIQEIKKYAVPFSCIIMFLIGGSLGAIIKRGGLGVPVIISVIFFVVYYVISMTTEKWAKVGAMDVTLAMWSANIVLTPVALLFLWQAHNDSRLLDTDFYYVWYQHIRKKLGW